MRLDIESLRAFKTVVELGGVTRAAARLHLTQSAVSHKLKRLEERVGYPLLRRGETGVVATVEGRALLEYAERLLALHDEAVGQFRPSDVTGGLRLGLTEDAIGAGIARVLGRFARTHTKVSVSAKVDQSLVLFEEMTNERIDLAVAQVFEEDLRPTDRILWWDELVWAQSQDFGLPSRDPIPFVSFDENCFYRRWALSAVAAQTLTLKIVLDCPSIAGVRSAVRGGLGVSIINRRSLGDGLCETDMPLPMPPPVAYVARTSATTAPSPVSALADMLAEELGEHPRDRHA